MAVGHRILVRLPPDVREWLTRQCEANASNQTSEIVRCIRERMDREIERKLTLNCN